MFAGIYPIPFVLNKRITEAAFDCLFPTYPKSPRKSLMPSQALVMSGVGKAILLMVSHSNPKLLYN